VVDPVSVTVVVGVAALGGALGAALGGYLALGALGCLVALGELLALLDVALPVATPLGYGVVLGPHVVLGGGVAAAAYGARRGFPDESFPYHPAKDVTTPLAGESGALGVGAAFGVFGVGVATAYAALDVPFDPVAATVVLSAFVHRVALGYPLVGAVRGGVLDLSPYERGDRREPMTDGGTPVDGAVDGADPTGRPDYTPRLVVEPFAPYQADWSTAAALGGGVGVLAAGVTYLTASAHLAFGLAAALLLGFAVRGAVPVVYHVAFVAGLSVLALGPANPTPAALAATTSLPVALGVGALAGVATALLGELLERLFYAHADTHFDAPFAALLLASVVLAVLDAAGVVALAPL
jgi:hypothetical protein